ncbi:MAG: FecR domain-containing protein [Cellulophaga sp.]
MYNSDKRKSILEKIDAALINGEEIEESEISEILSEENKKRILLNITDDKEEAEYFESEKQKVLDSIVGSQKQAPKIRYMRWLYAAASIAILLGATFLLTKNDDGLQNNETTIVGNNIKIGTDKATLTLESGKEVTLIKGASFHTLNANSNGKKIVYNTGDNAVAEIAYNYLTIPRGGQFNVTLADGTQVWLNSETQLKYPVAFVEGQPRQVELLYGEAYFDVSPSTNHKGAKFKVIHKSQEIEVLGTEFNIKAYKDETNIYTTLVEGAISLDTPENAKIILSPNYQANLNLNSNTIKTILVDVYNETSWKKGVFSFKGKTLEEIMRVLSRWYNVDIIFANEKLKGVLFDGVLGKDENITTLLKLTKTANFINAYAYDIDQNTIILH